MKRIGVFCIVVTLLVLFVTCVKDIKKEEIFSETEITGVVIEKSENTPLSDIKVKVTDGDHIHASTTTRIDGTFSMKVKFSEVNDNYYLLLDGSPDLPSKQEALRGMGKEIYDYKILVLYDKTDTELLPQITTGGTSSIMGHTAIVNGVVSHSGSKPLIERGVCYATHQTPTIADSVSVAGAEVGSFSCNLTNLQTSTSYYYRAYATNSIGISYGEQKMFTTTDGLPSVTTTAPSNILATTAQSGGNVTTDGGSPVTARGVCWNTMGNPNISDSHTTNGTGSGTFTANITGLLPSTTYRVRAYATNSDGTKYGEEKVFTTTNGLPSVTTNTPINVMATTAQCGGSVTSDGGSPVTARGVCWNTMGNPNVNDSHTTNGTGNGTFMADISGLTPNTTYHVRAYVTNSMGTSYGQDKTFTTTSGLPTVVINNVSDVTAVSAMLSGDVTNDNGYTITEKGFCWSIHQYPTVNDNHVNVGIGAGTFVSSATSLLPNTTYYVRAYATNSNGTSYSSQLSFQTTLGLPTVTTTAVTKNGSIFVSGGNVTDDGGFEITARGVCYGVYPNPDLSPVYTHTEDGTGTGFFSSVLGTLTGIIYVRAYATNANGTAYGDEIVANADYLSLPTFAHNGHVYRVAPSSGNTMTASNADSYCQNLDLYGFSDWQEPNEQQLLQMYNNRVSIGGFLSVRYWSSTHFYQLGSIHWVYVDFSNGTTGNISMELSSGTQYRVRPIRQED